MMCSGWKILLRARATLLSWATSLGSLCSFGESERWVGRLLTAAPATSGQTSLSNGRSVRARRRPSQRRLRPFGMARHRNGEPSPLSLCQALAARIRLIVWCSAAAMTSLPISPRTSSGTANSVVVIDKARRLRCSEGERSISGWANPLAADQCRRMGSDALATTVALSSPPMRAGRQLLC